MVKTKTKKTKKKASKKPTRNRRMRPGRNGNGLLLDEAGPGRPKGSLDFATKVKRIAAAIKPGQLIDPKDHALKALVDSLGMDLDDASIISLYREALNGNVQALNTLLDRVYGKVKNELEVGGSGQPIAVQIVGPDELQDI